jgi:hypothetical protein
VERTSSLPHDHRDLSRPPVSPPHALTASLAKLFPPAHLPLHDDHRNANFFIGLTVKREPGPEPSQPPVSCGAWPAAPREVGVQVEGVGCMMLEKYFLA